MIEKSNQSTMKVKSSRYKKPVMLQEVDVLLEYPFAASGEEDLLDMQSWEITADQDYEEYQFDL